VDDFATTPQNTNVNIPVQICSVTQPEHGTAGIRPDGTVIYKPDPDYVGEDSSTYETGDSNDVCDDATVTVTVEPLPNNPPV